MDILSFLYYFFLCMCSRKKWTIVYHLTLEPLGFSRTVGYVCIVCLLRCLFMTPTVYWLIVKSKVVLTQWVFSDFVSLMHMFSKCCHQHISVNECSILCSFTIYYKNFYIPWHWINNTLSNAHYALRESSSKQYF